jgi:hypothetical protein
MHIDWEGAANKLLSAGLDVLLHKGAADDPHGGNLVEPTTMGGLQSKLPWILGGLAVVGIGIILWKR